ncbi:intradiol ring-cleavage dioxygenase [Coprinopsis cinerea okayama7|uniref:Intradiol ring-cleavage dioxygenase n=1 Tax=Coprinopsis cinerea (strain Okayama-7 / 130 / ATCC MYA-4618 / FGSC 9003) TaxID=240176 RepID=A8P985_COPC7|nr:intradiol ring-cleavage dioxygenase [Coprinopsis cinerea okayama7\|eukprot:XP_001839720.2 intradiol ring-cleavage dioxygenase [Coprinopsis cinerea okayama7\
MDPGALAREAAARNGLDPAKLPPIIDMNSENITENVHIANSNCPDERTKFIFERLITHIHDFVRETSLTTKEWETAIEFLTKTGKMCSDIRQEFILLSDTLGVSTLVDAINNAKPPGATEGTVLGPFLTADAKNLEEGESIATEGKGHYMYVEGRVLDTKGNPVPGAVIETWETDGFGHYDVQYENREEPDCRGRFRSKDDGSFSYRAVVPVPYSIPDDGPVADMVRALGRHTVRPAHLHVRIDAPGFENLTTALYFEGDPYVTSDVVFGVKSSLIMKTEIINDPELSKARGFPDPSKPHVYLKRNFVILTPEEAGAAREALRLKQTGTPSSTAKL